MVEPISMAIAGAKALPALLGKAGSAAAGGAKALPGLLGKIGSSPFGKSALQGLGGALGQGLGQDMMDGEDDEDDLIKQLQASLGQRIGTQSFNPNISPVQGILGN